MQLVATVAANDRRVLPVPEGLDVQVSNIGRLGEKLDRCRRYHGEQEQDQALEHSQPSARARWRVSTIRRCRVVGRHPLNLPQEYRQSIGHRYRTLLSFIGHRARRSLSAKGILGTQGTRYRPVPSRQFEFQPN